MSKSSIRRSWTVVGVFLVLALIGLVGATTSHADANFGFARLSGTDRYDTAKDVAAKTFGTSDIVVIASGETFPDALAAAYAAGLPSVPILLTAKDKLPAPTSTAITSLKATKALIVGGTSAVSAAVETELKNDGLSTNRVAGTNRYDTAAKVARSGGPDVVGTTGGPIPPAVPTAIVVSGETFADALSAGPAAHAAHLPVLLTPQAGLAPETKAFLGDADYGIGAVLIVGGTAAVSKSVEDEIAAMDIEVTRLAGASRSETATKVADYEIENLAFTNAHADLSRGDGFADALAAGPHGGKAKAPLLLTQDPNTLSTATSTWLKAHASTLKDGHIMGGTAAVSTAVETEGEKAAGNTTGSTTSSSSTSSTTTTAPSLPPCPEGQQGPGGDFCFGTETSGAPKFTNAVLTYRTTPPPFTNTVTVTYSEPVKCSSVQAGDYQLKVTDAPLQADDPLKDELVEVFSLTCGNTGSTTSATIVLRPAKTIGLWREGTVLRKAGSTPVVDAADSPQSLSDTAPWTGPKFTRTIALADTPGQISVTYGRTLDCTSVLPSDFTVTIADGTELTILSATCDLDTVLIRVQEEIGNTGTGTVQLASLTTTVTDTDGKNQPTDDCIDWKTGVSTSTHTICDALP
jgi:putative cell wall-binding protein